MKRVLVSDSPERTRRVTDDVDVARVLDYDAFHGGAASEAYDAVSAAMPPAVHPEGDRRRSRETREKPLAATASYR